MQKRKKAGASQRAKKPERKTAASVAGISAGESRGRDSKPLLFISHRHADAPIANAIRQFVRTQSRGKVAVFQSSAATAVRPRIGRVLSRELMDALWKVAVVILIYTTPDEDWSYCMWECGVAMDPRSPDTRIIVFQCGDHAPAVFADQVRVNARNPVDIQKFTNEFLTSEQFFPRLSGALSDYSGDGPEVAEAAEELRKKLEPLLPKIQEETTEEWPAWPFLQV